MKAPAYEERVAEYQRAHPQRFINLLSELVKRESPSFDLESQHRILDFLESQFSQLSFHTRRLPGRRSGGHLLAYPSGRARGSRAQLLLGHCDTVWPLGTLQEMPLVVDRGKLLGPGSYDMKAGLAMLIFALETVQELGLPLPLTPLVFINSDEEIGSLESTRHIQRLACCAARAYVLEPSLGPTGRLKTARKGVGAFQVRVKGQAAHAGLEPGRGASAILELSYVIQKLFALSNLETGTTVNVGMVDGGLRPNVVAPESQARVDVRVLNLQEGERVSAAIAAIEPSTPGVEISISGGFGRPPMEFTPGNRRLFDRARQLGKSIGLELEWEVAGGGSDGNTTSRFIPTLDGLGAVGQGAHAADEGIEIESTLKRAELLTLLLLIDEGGRMP